MKIKLEYIWLDGNTPQQIRSKTKICQYIPNGSKTLMLPSRPPVLRPQDCPEWSFDGSSTNQAKGHDSDCFLKPVFTCLDPLRADSLLVLCEVLNADRTPHLTNTRHLLIPKVEETRDQEPWFGIEQEYFLFKDGKPLGFPKGDKTYPAPQGPYYCGVGGDRAFGRVICEAHVEACIQAGLEICGTNAEVAPGQWEFQLGILDPVNIGDQLWIARYLLNRIAEDHDTIVILDPKPLGKNVDFNGSGGHTNFSTKATRAEGGMQTIEEICNKLADRHSLHMAGYGEGNRERMTGIHETCGYDQFKFGNSDRGCSIRIPLATRSEGKGYFEDRRPAANLDPYTVCRLLLEAIGV